MVYYEIQINLDTLTYSATLSDIDTLFHLSKLIWNGKSQSLHEKCWRMEQDCIGLQRQGILKTVKNAQT
jgi:hypothetical protein